MFSVKPGLSLTELERVRMTIKELEAELVVKKKQLQALEGGSPPAKKEKKLGNEKNKSEEPKDVKDKTEAPKAPAPRDWRFDLVRSVGEECQEDEELAVLLSKKQTGFRFYDGFEPSGRMHVAQGLQKTINVNKCTKAGGTFVFWVADWFALMNDKMGGKLDRIRTVGEYLIEVWKAAGMNLENVEFVWSSDEINKKAEQYWIQMLDVARQFTLTRVMKCCQIMGRSEGTLTCAQILYPLMQCTDIFFLRADICQLGLDQRKVNMFAREYCNAVGRKNKPIILSHHMMMGLLKGQGKASKSVKGSAVFMEDTEEEVAEKLNNAYCPTTAEEVADNPLLDFVNSLVLSEPGGVFKAKISGKQFKTLEEMQKAVVSKDLTEEDLRASTIDVVNARLGVVRKHFTDNEHARQILELVKKYKAEADAEAKEGKKGVTVPKVEDDGGMLIVVLPTQQVTLNSVLSTVMAAREALEAGKRVTVLLQDWSAYLLKVFEDLKSIKAVLEYFALWTRAAVFRTDEERAKYSKNFEIKWQSEEILSNPDKYWVSVINFGRSISLQDMGTMLQRDYTTGENETANLVVASLMLLQDVVSAGFRSVVVPRQVFAGTMPLVGAVVKQTPLAVPCLKEAFATEPAIDGSFPETLKPSIIFCNEPEAVFSPKIKKAFCTPEDAVGNPVLMLAQNLVTLTGTPLSVPRKKEGDVLTPENNENLAQHVASGAVHPSDLKPAVQTVLKALMADLRTTISKDPSCKQLEDQIKNITKKLEKNAKRKN